jgi:hypothetical protein
VNFPFVFSNIPAALAYVVYISQLIRYSRACDSYYDLLDVLLLLTRKLLNQDFQVAKLKWRLRQLYCRHHDLVHAEYLGHKWQLVCSVSRNHSPVLSSLINYHRICNKSYTTVATCGAETAYPSGTNEFTPGGVRVARSLVFCVMFCRSEMFVLFVLSVLLQFTAFDHHFGIFKLIVLLLISQVNQTIWECFIFKTTICFTLRNFQAHRSTCWFLPQLLPYHYNAKLHVLIFKKRHGEV